MTEILTVGPDADARSPAHTTSTATQILTPSAAIAYDTLAAAYDTLTRDYCYEVWLQRIEELAVQHGLAGHRLLDVACGTGSSFLPLARRGYCVTACDISERMVELARVKAPEADVRVADMRALGRLGSFDLITCLDDAVNYLLSGDELGRFMDGLAANLAPGGIAVFDVNTLKLYREGFARDWLVDADESFIAWSGQISDESGGRASATVRVFSRSGVVWTRSDSRHEQRHWPREAIDLAAAGSGLQIAAVHGQTRGAVLEPEFDELAHDKALYVATRRERR